MWGICIMKKSEISYLIKLAIGAFFLFFFRYLPPAAPITELGMQIVGIFIGTIFLIATINPAWPAFLGILLCATTPLYNMTSALAASFGNWVPVFLIGSFLLGHVLVDSGIAKRLVMWMITLPVLQGKPWLFTSVFLFSIVALGYFVDCFALIAFYLGCATTIYEQLGYKKGEKFPTGLTIGIGFIVAMAGASTPFQVNVTIVLAQFAQFSGVEIPSFSYITWGLVPMILMFIVYMLIFRFVINPDMSNFKNLDIQSLAGEKTKISKREIGVGIIYLGVVVLWILPGVLQLLGVGAELAATLNAYGLAFPPMVGVVLMCAIRLDEQPLMDFKASAKTIPWPVIYLVASNMILGSALGNSEVGFTAWFQQVAEPLITGVSPVIFVIFIAIMTLLMTNVGSNSVAAIVAFQMASLLVPPGLSLAVVSVIIAFCSRSAYCLPSSCTALSTIYGDEWLDSKKILPLGVIMCLITAVLMGVIGLPLGNMIIGF